MTLPIAQDRFDEFPASRATMRTRDVFGDFNFVTCASDRISKDAAESEMNNADRVKAAAWDDAMALKGLREFSQTRYTCESSFGWSRIDKMYTNIQVADILTTNAACCLLPHPRHMSDHSPVSFSMTKMPYRSQ